MTHTKEQERAHALAEKHGATSYRNRADTSNPAFGFTLGQLEALISEVEQAARRATAAPVPQSEPVAYLWQHCETGRTRVVMPDMVITADANWIVVGPLYLAAAPQPPEVDMGIPISAATPVQLPEYGIDTANHAGVRVRGYTEQQVRQLLAAAKVERKT